MELRREGLWGCAESKAEQGMKARRVRMDTVGW